jgi:hypothetical protein
MELRSLEYPNPTLLVMLPTSNGLSYVWRWYEYVADADDASSRTLPALVEKMYDLVPELDPSPVVGFMMSGRDV